MKSKIFCITVILIVIHLPFINAQSNQIKAIKIGDTVPNIELKMINYKKTTAHISDFKGKLLILDFWASSCSACLAQFPKFTAIQKHFQDSITILPVGFDALTPGSVNEAILKRKGTSREIKLPSVLQETSDSIMFKLFPYEWIPHEVWIDKSGVLIAETDDSWVTDETIQKILNGGKVKFTMKMISDFSPDSLNLIDVHSPSNSLFAFKSFLIQYNYKIKPEESTESDSEMTKLFYPNEPVWYLIKSAYYGFNSYLDSTLIFDTGNKRLIIESSSIESFEKFMSTAYIELPEEFRKKNLFSYGLFLPASFSLREAYQIMLNDLQSYFKIQVEIEKRKVNCLALVRISKEDKLKSSGRPLTVEYAEDNLQITIINTPILNLVSYLNGSLEIAYVIDETNYKKNVDVDIAVSNIRDLTGLKKALNKYGLDLVEKQYDLDMLIIKDKISR